MERKELIEKIKKVLALRESPNENEAELAARKAEEMLRKYNISMAEIGEAEIEIREMAFTDGRVVWGVEDESVKTEGAKWPQWEGILASGLSKGYNLGAFYSGYKGKQKLIFVGTEADLQVGQYMFIYLVRTVKEMATVFAKEYKKVVGTKCPPKMREDYRQGCADTLYYRLVEIGKVSEEKYQETKTGKELVIVKGGKIKEYMENMKFAKGRKKKDKERSGAYFVGREQGKEISINQGIKNSEGIHQIR